MKGIKTLLLTLVLAGVVAGTSNAADPKVSPADRVTGTLVVETGAGVLPGAPAMRALTDATPKCNVTGFWQRYSYRSRLGFVLWRYDQQVYACFAGKPSRDGIITNGKLTYFSRYRWFEIPDLVPGFGLNPWKFLGDEDAPAPPPGFGAATCESDHCLWSGVADEMTAVTRGHFEACMVPIAGWICRDVYPLLTITVYGTTGYTHDERSS